jgi:hypothetical protein
MAGLDLAAVARLTGLEPATPGVTGRYSNQLSYNRPLHVRQGTSGPHIVLPSHRQAANWEISLSGDNSAMTEMGSLIAGLAI